MGNNSVCSDSGSSRPTPDRSLELYLSQAGYSRVQHDNWLQHDAAPTGERNRLCVYTFWSRNSRLRFGTLLYPRWKCPWFSLLGLDCLHFLRSSVVCLGDHSLEFTNRAEDLRFQFNSSECDPRYLLLFHNNWRIVDRRIILDTQHNAFRQ